jgi:hypothetical protein
MLARRSARRQAGALAARLGRDIGQLLDAEAALRRAAAVLDVGDAGRLLDGAAARAAARDDVARCRRQVRATVDRIDETLDFGLDFEFVPDPDLGYRRGHARNVALVIRRNVQLALGPAADSASRSRYLSEVRRLAEELSGTIGWIQRRVSEVEAGAPTDEWSATWSGRLLAVAARLLPAHRRRDFIEDQCGNLEQVEPRGEWARYMLGLLARMPDIAAVAPAAGDPEPSARGHRRDHGPDPARALRPALSGHPRHLTLRTRVRMIWAALPPRGRWLACKGL